MKIRVRVLPGTVLSDNRDQYQPGDELDMEQAEAERRIKQGLVEAVKASSYPAEQGDGKMSAAEKIAAAQAATSLVALSELKFGEERKTVLAAIDAREQELSK